MSGTDWSLRLYRGKWAAVKTDERGRTTRRSSGTRDRETAERWFSAFLHALNKPKRPENFTVGTILDAYYRDRKVFPRPSLNATFGHSQPEHVTKDRCATYQAKRTKAGMAVATVHTELGILRSALRWAEKEGWIERAPHVPLPQRPPGRDQWLSREEAAALIDACTVPHVKLFILLALHTGARAGAILDLTWDRVNDRFIDFNPPDRVQTKKRRAVVPITPTLQAALQEARKATVSDYVVEYAGRQVKSVKRGFKGACAKAGLTDVTPHVIRHTAATWMAQAGVDMRRIALYLGHSDSRTTERVYSHYAPDYLNDAAAALEHSAQVVHLNQKTGTNDEDRS